jgi:hypothetical protein
MEASTFPSFDPESSCDLDVQKSTLAFQRQYLRRGKKECHDRYPFLDMLISTQFQFKD